MAPPQEREVATQEVASLLPGEGNGPMPSANTAPTASQGERLTGPIHACAPPTQEEPSAETMKDLLPPLRRAEVDCCLRKALAHWMKEQRRQDVLALLPRVLRAGVWALPKGGWCAWEPHCMCVLVWVGVGVSVGEVVDVDV